MGCMGGPYVAVMISWAGAAYSSSVAGRIYQPLEAGLQIFLVRGYNNRFLQHMLVGFVGDRTEAVEDASANLSGFRCVISRASGG